MLNNNYPIVLLYHQISDSAHPLINQYNITIQPKVFDLHVKAIKKYFTPISVKEFEYAYKNNIDVRKRILITFDDGYKDAINNGSQILSRNKLDSVWFINSRFCNNEKVFWLSKVMWISDKGLLTEFMKKAKLRFPGLLSLQDKSKHINFNSWIKDNYSRVLEGLIDEFVSYYGFEEEKIAKRADLFATCKDIKRLSKVAHVGIHTVSHPNVRNISLNDFKKETEECFCKVSRITKVIPYFAFPFGQIFDHWTPVHVDILNKLGYKWIFSVANQASKISEYIPGNIIPRFEVPCNITSVRGFKEFMRGI